MRKLSFLLFLLPSFVFAVGDEKQFPLTDFHCGVDSYHSPLNIPNCYVQDSLNVFFDQQTYATKRQGYTIAFSSKSYQITGLWSYTDSSNNIWMVARSSDTLMATTGIGTSNFNVKIATVASANVVNAVVAFGNIYFVDQTQGVYYWNGSTTVYVSGSPKGSLITQFHGRLWVMGQAVPNGQILNGSKYLDGSTWNTGSLSTDPVQFTVNLADNFDVTTAFFSGYNDVLYLFMNYSINGLYGFDQTDFQIRLLNKEVGCIDQRSVQPFQGGLVFASARGLEFFDGYTATRISDPIKNKVDPITLNSSFNSNSWVQQNATDWNSGTFIPSSSLSALAAPPALVLSTFSATDTTNTDFSSGTFNNTYVLNNSVIISTNNSGNITNPDFESSFSGNWVAGTSWSQTSSGGGGSCGTISPESGSEMATYFTVNGTWSLYFEAIDLNSNLVQQTSAITVGGNTCSWTAATFTPSSSSIGRRVKFRFHINKASTDSYLTTTDSYIWGGPISFFWNSNDGLNTGKIYVDNVTLGSSTITTGSFTSQTFNTLISSPIVYTAADWTVNTSTPYFEVQSATASTGPWSKITISTATNVLMSQYVRYISSFTVGSADNAISSLDDVSFTSTSSSGTLKSQIHNLGSISSFGNFSVTQDLTAGGSIAYSICSSTNSNMGFPASCGSQTANAAISIATGTFVQVYATFTVTAATQAPALDAFTVNWFTGTSRPPMASSVYDNRYWLSVTTNTSDSANDSTLILSKGPIWSVFSTQAGAFVLWKNALYHADANATGNVYQDNQGYQDNTTPITAYIRTKDYSPDTWVEDKYFETLYMTVDNSGTYNVSTQYFIDGSTVPYSLSTVSEDEQVGRNYAKLPFPIGANNQVFGKSISFLFQNSDANAPMQLYGGVLVYRSRPPL